MKQRKIYRSNYSLMKSALHVLELELANLENNRVVSSRLESQRCLAKNIFYMLGLFL